jgi:two-component system LytT family response regulator
MSLEIRSIQRQASRPKTLYRDTVSHSQPSSELNTLHRFLSRIAARQDDKLVLVQMAEIVWIQSNGNFVCLHAQKGDFSFRTTMNDLYTRLDPSSFLRVHRNAIVNLDHVVEFDLPRYGNAFVQLRNGKALPISRTGRMALRRSFLSRSYGSGDHAQM